MLIDEEEQQRINKLVEHFELQCDAQLVCAVVGKADTYPDIPWKAYALGSAGGAVGLYAAAWFAPAWLAATTGILHVLVVLGAGALLCLASTLVPRFAALFLDRTRAKLEVRQYAHAMLLDRDLARTSERRAALLLLSRFEGAAALVLDRGLADRVASADRRRIEAVAEARLRTGGYVAAFEAALSALRALMPARAAHSGNGAVSLPDAVISETGE